MRHYRSKEHSSCSGRPVAAAALQGPALWGREAIARARRDMSPLPLAGAEGPLGTGGLPVQRRLGESESFEKSLENKSGAAIVGFGLIVLLCCCLVVSKFLKKGKK